MQSKPSARPSPPATPRAARRRTAPLDGVLHPHIFRALGDPSRIGILACLAKCARPCAVSEIAECCDLDLSVVSRHLRALEDAAVLASERQGRIVRYRVRYTEVAAWFRAVADAIESCARSGCCDPASACGCAPTAHPRT